MNYNQQHNRRHNNNNRTNQYESFKFNDGEPFKYLERDNEHFDKFINCAQRFVKDSDIASRNGVKTSQLRNFYDEILQVTDSNYGVKLPLLKVKLAYAMGRKVITRDFYEVVEKMINDVINKPAYLENFKLFMEAVVAYHKMEAKE